MKKKLVGILNCTPDSYFEGGRFSDPEKAIAYAVRLFEQGADVVDIGGESTRPDSALITVEEELRRVIPVIKGIRKETPLPLSIDSYKPEVAEAALDAGVDWINDITGFSDPRMRRIARESGATLCIMHMYGAPHTQPTPFYPDGVVQGLLDFFNQRVHLLEEEGISPSKVILDPGIGGGAFGKSPNEVLQILKELNRIVALGFPVLISLSRKSFLQKIFNKSPSELLSTTLALNTMALLAGASYIRVHDVAEHKEIVTLLELIEAI